MPCFQVRTIGVDLAVASRDLLDKAIAADRELLMQQARRAFWIEAGQVKSRALSQWQLEAVAKRLKQGYAAQAITQAAARFGWQVTRQSATQFTAQRRF